jgi:hypothetical protein
MRFLISFGVAALVPLAASADTIINGGTLINQTWTPAGNNYVILGDVTVPVGSTLTIQPGTIVRLGPGDMQGGGLDTMKVEMVVNGSLVAVGTAGQNIVFTADNGVSGSWYGIELKAGGLATISYLDVAKAQVGLESSAMAQDLQLSLSSFHDGVAGLQIDAGAPNVSQIAAFGNSTNGIVVTGVGISPKFDRCLVYSNLVDGLNSGFNGPVVTNSVFYGNGGSGIDHTAGGLIAVTNCTLRMNVGSGIRAGASFTANASVVNCIVTENGSGVRKDSGTVTVTYSDVWNNTTNYIGVAAGAGCISQNPQYVNAAAGDLHLQSASVCIDTGTASGAPDHDFDGHFRPVDGDGINGAAFDMGAYELCDDASATPAVTAPGSATVTQMLCQ